MLEEKIYQDYVAALKSKNKHKADFLSFVRAGLKNKAIDLKCDKLDDEMVLAALKKEQKRLLDTKQSLIDSGRRQLLEDTEKELAIIRGYLPRPLEEERLKTIISEVIASTKATSIKDMGKVMKEVLDKTAGRADSKTVSQIVRNKLSDTH